MRRSAKHILCSVGERRGRNGKGKEEERKGAWQ